MVSKKETSSVALSEKDGATKMDFHDFTDSIQKVRGGQRSIGARFCGNSICFARAVSR